MKEDLKEIWYMFMHRLGFTPNGVANQWAMDASRYRQFLYQLKQETPHDTIKQEIDDVLYPQDDPDL